MEYYSAMKRNEIESIVAAAAAKSLQLCPTLCDPIDDSPPGSAVPGILQARTLEWVAIFFSNAWKWKVKVRSLSRVRLFVTPWTVAYQAFPSMGFFQARVLEWGAIAFSKGDGEHVRWGRAYQCFRQHCRLSVMCRALHITCRAKAYFSNRSWLPYPKAEPPLGLSVTWAHKFLFLNVWSTDSLSLESDTMVTIYTPCLRFRPFFFVLKNPTCPVLLLLFPLFKD